jgi:hypothetical protein
MKKINWITVLILIVFSGAIVAMFAFTINSKTLLSKNVSHLRDSINTLNSKSEYMTRLIDVEFTENSQVYSFDSIKAYRLIDGKQQFFKPLNNIFREGRKKIVLRYTEIGCNPCADSTIRFLNQHKKILANYDVLVLVDFSNYDAYLKWRKISEVDFPVLWVQKGELPFEIEQHNSSYLFTVNSSLTVNNFFIPNSMISAFIHAYLNSIESKI